MEIFVIVVYHACICRFSSKKLSSKHIEYFYDILTNFDVHGICCRSSEDGYVVTADLKICGMLMSKFNYIVNAQYMCMYTCNCHPKW